VAAVQAAAIAPPKKLAGNRRKRERERPAKQPSRSLNYF